MLCCLSPLANGRSQERFQPGFARGLCRWLLTWGWVVASGWLLPSAGAVEFSGQTSSVVHTNVIVPSGPWSIHVVKVPRAGAQLEIRSQHAGGGALGLSTLRDQVGAVDGKVLAAINGGFYRRDSVYAGAARGLQIVAGEVISAPASNACFWTDLNGEPHLASVTSEFRVILPDGTRVPLGLNEPRADNAVVLFTPAIGASTLTTNGLEFILERQAGSRWLPLRMGQFYTARVREKRAGGDTPLSPEVLVLSVGPALKPQFDSIESGARLQIFLGSQPSLSVARHALSAGPVLVAAGRRQRFRAAEDDAYELSSMLEQHPRSAIGWNKDACFLVQVDGRQRDVSVGMTLDELADFLVKLGCQEAMNLDGGGSATLWYDGEVRNNPCDGYERTIANSLIVVQKAGKGGSRPVAQQRQGTTKEAGGAD